VRPPNSRLNSSRPFAIAVALSHDQRDQRQLGEFLILAAGILIARNPSMGIPL
jgi:hypothetical protein